MGGLLLLILFVCVYFLPYINAVIRKHSKAPAIMIINLFLGWTLIGWVLVFAWSTTENNQNKTTVGGE